MSGCIVIEVSSTGADTVVAQVGQILNQTADYRAEIESRGERPPTRQSCRCLAWRTGARYRWWTGRSDGPELQLHRQYADRGAAFDAELSRSGDPARHPGQGRSRARALNQVDTVIFDKTGTLTLDEPHIGQIYTCDGISSDELCSTLRLRKPSKDTPSDVPSCRPQPSAVCQCPLPTAPTTRWAMASRLKLPACASRSAAPAHGDAGRCHPPEIAAQEQPAHQQGHTLISRGHSGSARRRHRAPPDHPARSGGGRQRAAQSWAVASYPLGDHPEPTRHLANQLGIEHYFAEVLPADKAAMVADLQRQGKRVCFIGDGINDAIALKQANASISLSGASGIAIDMAQIVMMDGSLRQLPQFFALCAEFDNNMNAGLMINLIPSVLCIGGVFVFHVGLWTSAMLLNLSLAASVANAMRPRLKPSEAAHA